MKKYLSIIFILLFSFYAFAKKATNINTTLNPVGTKKKNINGSFDAKGFTMIRKPGEEPRFVNNNPSSITDVGMF